MAVRLLATTVRGQRLASRSGLLDDRLDWRSYVGDAPVGEPTWFNAVVAATVAVCATCRCGGGSETDIANEFAGGRLDGGRPPAPTIALPGCDPDSVTMPLDI
jgi:hypothetical protein